MGQTITEKIFSQHSGKKVKADDIVIAKVDFCFGQDGTSLLVIEKFKSLGTGKIFSEKNFFAMVIDHSSPSPNQKISEIHNLMRKFSREQNAQLYDIGEGVCHQVIVEKGYVLPGSLICGADSHTCTYGALNAFATGMGSTDIAVILAYGKNWFRVPQTIKIIIEGKIPKGVFAKDIILYIIGKLKADYASYKAIEYTGSVVERLNMDGRFTLANMSVEIGAKAGIMPFDKKIESWLSKHTNKRFKPVFPDKDAHYESVVEFDISKIEPQVACPHSVDNVKSIFEIKGKKIDQAFLGTCTNGRLEDLEIAAKILKGKRVRPRVKFIIAPISKKVFLGALKKGIIEVFVKAGAVVISPGCGPCVGTHAGIPSDNEVVISTANRNFKGRMGNPNASIYLASPATVAASAVEGKITDPRKFL